MSTQENTSTDTSPEKVTSSSGTTYNISLTPEQIKRIEENRLKAQAKLKEKQRREELQSNSTNAEKKDTQGIITNIEDKKLRPMRQFQNYVEYDFSKLKDSRGGFLIEEQSDENSKNRKWEQPEPELEALEPRKIIFKKDLFN
jgi:DNA-repair protein complementing XP-A cells